MIDNSLCADGVDVLFTAVGENSLFTGGVYKNSLFTDMLDGSIFFAEDGNSVFT